MISPFDSDGQLIREVCVEAMLRRDPAYDGVFFVCVRTTKIYCRPVCRVKLPRPENVSFVPSAVAAEQRGYRACLRCRPDSLPWSPAWRGSEAVVRRGLRIIGQEFQEPLSPRALAQRLGVGSRHLSRLFKQHVGASPYKVITAHRLQQARRLITETDKAFSEIAFECGFGSIRCFNDAVRRRYGLTPSRLRRSTQPRTGATHANR